MIARRETGERQGGVVSHRPAVTAVEREHVAVGVGCGAAGGDGDLDIAGGGRNAGARDGEARARRVPSPDDHPAGIAALHRAVRRDAGEPDDVGLGAQVAEGGRPRGRDRLDFDAVEEDHVAVGVGVGARGGRGDFDRAGGGPRLRPGTVGTAEPGRGGERQGRTRPDGGQRPEESSQRSLVTRRRINGGAAGYPGPKRRSSPDAARWTPPTPHRSKVNSVSYAPSPSKS